MSFDDAVGRVERAEEVGGRELCVLPARALSAAGKVDRERVEPVREREEDDGEVLKRTVALACLWVVRELAEVGERERGG